MPTRRLDRDFASNRPSMRGCIRKKKHSPFVCSCVTVGSSRLGPYARVKSTRR